jgi:hypothetical protein
MSLTFGRMRWSLECGDATFLESIPFNARKAYTSEEEATLLMRQPITCRQYYLSVG